MLGLSRHIAERSGGCTTPACPSRGPSHSRDLQGNATAQLQPPAIHPSSSTTASHPREGAHHFKPTTLGWRRLDRRRISSSIDLWSAKLRVLVSIILRAYIWPSDMRCTLNLQGEWDGAVARVSPHLAPPAERAGPPTCTPSQTAARHSHSRVAAAANLFYHSEMPEEVQLDPLERAVVDPKSFQQPHSVRCVWSKGVDNVAKTPDARAGARVGW